MPLSPPFGRVDSWIRRRSLTWLSRLVKRFLPSEFSSNTLSDTVQELVPVFQSKKEVLDYLKSKEIEGMSWTGIASGLLFDWVRKRYVHTANLTS